MSNELQDIASHGDHSIANRAHTEELDVILELQNTPGVTVDRLDANSKSLPLIPSIISANVGTISSVGMALAAKTHYVLKFASADVALKFATGELALTTVKGIPGATTTSLMSTLNPAGGYTGSAGIAPVSYVGSFITGGYALLSIAMQVYHLAKIGESLEEINQKLGWFDLRECAELSSLLKRSDALVEQFRALEDEVQPNAVLEEFDSDARHLEKDATELHEKLLIEFNEIWEVPKTNAEGQAQWPMAKIGNLLQRLEPKPNGHSLIPDRLAEKIMKVIPRLLYSLRVQYCCIFVRASRLAQKGATARFLEPHRRRLKEAEEIRKRLAIVIKMMSSSEITVPGYCFGQRRNADQTKAVREWAGKIATSLDQQQVPRQYLVEKNNNTNAIKFLPYQETENETITAFTILPGKAMVFNTRTEKK